MKILYIYFLIINFIRRYPNLYKASLKIYGAFKKTKIKFLNNKISIQKNKKEITLNTRNISYVKEVIDFFNFYYNSVVKNGYYTNLDFSTPQKYLLTKSRIDFELYFSSIPTPSATSKEYLEILKPTEGDVILDLGSYCGVTVIDFLLSVGRGGFVLGVEADMDNYNCLIKNLENFGKNHHGYNFELTNLAISNKKDLKYFSNNKDMSSAIVGVSTELHQPKENYTIVKTTNLSNLIKKYKLNKVDIIKADIEGSELNMLKDDEFFKNFSPRILIEPILSKGKNSIQEILPYMDKYGYKYTKFEQTGAKQPLYLFEKI
ncbi:MAG: hypothetical protein CMD58_01950 [Gammaproteobacteria bacterium]|nr:hypothetical protein [Gammaproteobacteria bacterium]